MKTTKNYERVILSLNPATDQLPNATRDNGAHWHYLMSCQARLKQLRLQLVRKLGQVLGFLQSFSLKQQIREQ